jgi:hypothetical protein
VHLAPPGSDKSVGGRRLPIVRLCQSFCLSLFRSCGDVELMTEHGSNSSVTQQYESRANTEDELSAAEAFCLDQFREFPDFTARIVEDENPVRDGVGGFCYGSSSTQDTKTWDVCDPYEDQRFWYVVSASMKYNHGLALAIISMLLCVAAFCVGYNMMLVRRKANWMIERQIIEKRQAGQRFARDETDTENASFLVNERYSLQ